MSYAIASGLLRLPLLPVLLAVTGFCAAAAPEDKAGSFSDGTGVRARREQGLRVELGRRERVERGQHLALVRRSPRPPGRAVRDEPSGLPMSRAGGVTEALFDAIL